jgi:hypothetical protein
MFAHARTRSSVCALASVSQQSARLFEKKNKKKPSPLTHATNALPPSATQ